MTGRDRTEDTSESFSPGTVERCAVPHGGHDAAIPVGGHARGVQSVAGPGLLDVDGAASYLGVPKVFIRRLVLEKRVAYHKLGKYLRFKPADLDDFVNQGRVDPAAPPAPWKIQQKSNNPLMKNVHKGLPRRTKKAS